MTLRNLKKFYTVIGTKILTEVQNSYNVTDHVASAEARDSWIMYIDDANRIVIESKSEGAYYLEHGRPANRRPPPISEIIKWCEYKGIKIEKAYGIRINIGKNGIKPVKLIRKIAEKYSLKYTHSK